MAQHQHISILGASGYSGAALIRLLLRHPNFKIDSLFAGASAGKRIDELYPEFRGRCEKRLKSYSFEAISKSELVFIGLPSGEAMSVVPDLLKLGKRVIDLGGDFRILDSKVYELFYKHNHSAPELLSTAIYGLSEWNTESIKSARLIANPGCYPTSVLIPLIPLLRERLIEAQDITITSMSGVSGAGRKADLSISFCEVNNSVKAYKVTDHQHIPEIKQALNVFAKSSAQFSFVPHLIPITRGIYTTIHAKLAKDFHLKDISDVFSSYYEKTPFIRHSPLYIPELKGVVHTNYCDIGYRISEATNQLIICSAIDNLLKGAAGQAIQNANLMFGFDESEGLLD